MARKQAGEAKAEKVAGSAKDSPKTEKAAISDPAAATEATKRKAKKPSRPIHNQLVQTAAYGVVSYCLVYALFFAVTYGVLAYGYNVTDILSYAGVSPEDVVIEDDSLVALTFLVQRTYSHVRMALTGILVAKYTSTMDG